MADYIVANNTITLGKNDFVAQGGQASVYTKSDIAYKIYHDPTDMIPIAKINELKGITDPAIIRPQDVILDKQRKPVGYTMRFLKDTFVLCQLFTKSFCDKHRINNGKIINIVKGLKERYQNAHASNVLIVDGNEQNFLVNDQFSDIYAIDTDSWQTPSYAATVIMDSIRDRRMPTHNAFNQGTDWFAFAVVSCYLFMKIHPIVQILDDRMLPPVRMNKEQLFRKHIQKYPQ